MGKCYIGFDCGTQGSKVAIYADDATLLGEAYVEHQINYPRSGWVELEPDTFYQAVVGGIRRVISDARVDPADIGGISCSGIVCGLLPIDADWNPVGPFIPHLDTRSTEQVREIQREIEPLWIEESGNVDIETFVPPVMLRWLFQHRPDIISRTRKVLPIAPYVLGKLGGLRAHDAFIDWTHLSGWIIGYDARRADWSDRQLKLLGIPREILPRVTKPWDIVGELAPEQANLLGLRPGSPLIAGAGDIMQSNLGSGIVEHGMCADVAGTASIFSVDVGEINAAISAKPGILYSIATLEGHSLYWGYIRAGGLSLRWYRDNIAGRTDDGFYHELDTLIEGAPPGADLVLFYPYLGGGDPSLPNATGGWLNLRGSADRASLWRSMLESIAFEYRSHAMLFRSQNIPVNEIVGVGGGSRSRVWNQIKADVLEADYVMLQRSEGAVLANALLAAHGVGDIPDLKQAVTQWVAVRERLRPRPERSATYAAIHAKRQEILEGPLREIFLRLAELQDAYQSVA